MKKYVLKVDEKEIVVTEDEYQNMLNRFDIRKFKVIAYKNTNRILYENDTKCLFCVKEEDKIECGECSLHRFKPRCLGPACIYLMRKIVLERCFILNTNFIYYRLEMKIEAEKQLTKLRNAVIKNFKESKGIKNENTI